MVESTALEMRHTRKGIGGSNPSLSAIFAIARQFASLMAPMGGLLAGRAVALLAPRSDFVSNAPPFPH